MTTKNSVWDRRAIRLKLQSQQVRFLLKSLLYSYQGSKHCACKLKVINARRILKRPACSEAIKQEAQGVEALEPEEEDIYGDIGKATPDTSLILDCTVSKCLPWTFELPSF